MIGIVIVTHAGLAGELLQAAELILGPQIAVYSISIGRDVAVDVAQKKVEAAVTQAGADGDGTLILTDLFGGTPTNISAEFLQDGVVEILTGVNLPMLIKSLSTRSAYDLDGLAGLLKDYAKNAIMRPAELLRPSQG